MAFKETASFASTGKLTVRTLLYQLFILLVMIFDDDYSSEVVGVKILG
jgi:hypothetical protein